MGEGSQENASVPIAAPLPPIAAPHTQQTAPNRLIWQPKQPRQFRVECPCSPPTASAVALAWLDAERATLVAVAVHTASHGWPGHATRLAATLFRYLDSGGHYPEAIT